jgi:hypothetical protein
MRRRQEELERENEALRAQLAQRLRGTCILVFLCVLLPLWPSPFAGFQHHTILE